jgi:hypothetical protein
VKTKTQFIFPFLFSTLLLLGGVSLQASVIQLNFITLPSNNNDGTYNGFLSVTANGVTALNLICDDFGHTTYVPSGPDSFNLSTLANLSNTRFGSAAIYEQAALLIYGDGKSDLVGLMNDPSNTSAYQYALWNLTEPGAAAQAGHSDPGAAALLTTVQSLDLTNPSFQTLYSDLQIYTPVTGGTDQEFLGFTTQTTSLIFCWSIDLFNYQNVYRPFSSFQLESELLLDGREERYRVQLRAGPSWLASDVHFSSYLKFPSMPVAFTTFWPN